MMKILVLEPDKRTGKLIKQMLESDEMQVDVVASAQAAIHSADEQAPDLVMSELLLADQNGLAFLHEFRSHYDWTGIPVIIHSYVPPAEADFGSFAWKDMGVVDYLYKPTTSLAKLKSRIQLVLN